MARLGRTDVEIFPIVLGTNTFGWTSDEARSHAVLDAFREAGGNLVDTADVYSAWVPGHRGGEAERIIGSWLRRTGHPDDFLVATKVSGHPEFKGLGAENVRAACEASLARLGTDRIDLYFAHYDDRATPLEETVAAFDGLVKDGKVRHIGLSNYTAERVAAWFEIARGIGATVPVALEPHYSLLHTSTYEPGLRELASAEHLSVFPYWTLAGGFLTGKYRTFADLEGRPRRGMVEGHLHEYGLAAVDMLETIAEIHDVEPATVALAWTLDRPGITAPVVSARTTDQLGPILAAADLKLADDAIVAITELSEATAT